jgi:zinc D-Ala-D-Ala carboxypeptidase
MDARLAALDAELGISRALITSRGLTLCKEAIDLELVEVGHDGKEHLLLPAAAAAWRKLNAAALDDGITLTILSAFRSIDRQAGIIRRKLEAGMSIDDVLTVCAPPGFIQ